MAITQGISGNSGTLDSTSEVDLWVRSADGGSPLEFKVAAATATINFRFYYDDTNYLEVPVAAGNNEKIADTRRDAWVKLAAQSASTSAVPTWFPTISGY